MRNRIHDSWFSGVGISLPLLRHRTENGPATQRYMLEVYYYVACGLAVTGLAAAIVSYSGLHAAMVELTSPFFVPFVWILLLAPLALVMLLWLSVDDMNIFFTHAIAWSCSALTGFAFGCISLVYTETSLAPISFIAAGTFSLLSMYGYLTGSELSKPNHFVGMGVVGVVLACSVNVVVGSTAVQFGISVMAVIALVGLTALDTPRIKEIYLKRADDEVMGKTALVGAFALYFDANPVVLLLRLEDLLTDKRE